MSPEREELRKLVEDLPDEQVRLSSTSCVGGCAGFAPDTGRQPGSGPLDADIQI